MQWTSMCEVGNCISIALEEFVMEVLARVALGFWDLVSGAGGQVFLVGIQCRVVGDGAAERLVQSGTCSGTVT